MSSRELARYFDQQDFAREAALIYELLIQDGDVELDDFLDLATIYSTCTDYGYLSHHRLEDQFVVFASARNREILDLAEERLGAHPDVEFWRLLIDFAEIGEPPFPEAARKLAVSEKAQDVHLFLFGFLGEESSRQAASELFEWSRDQGSARKRYVYSVLSQKF